MARLRTGPERGESPSASIRAGPAGTPLPGAGLGADAAAARLRPGRISEAGAAMACMTITRGGVGAAGREEERIRRAITPASSAPSVPPSPRYRAPGWW